MQSVNYDDLTILSTQRECAATSQLFHFLVEFETIVTWNWTSLVAMSESGAMLYEKLKTGCSREDLIAALTTEYDVSEPAAAQDTDAFLAQMRQLNILIEDT